MAGAIRLWLPLAAAIVAAVAPTGRCCDGWCPPPILRSPCLQMLSDRNRERRLSSPKMLPYGDRLDVSCIFPSHAWPEVSIHVRLCYWPEIVRSLVVDAHSGQLLHNDVTCQISSGRWSFEDGGAAQTLTLSFRLITQTAGTYHCVLGNETHGVVTESTALVADVHELQKTDRSCDLAFGSRTQTKYLWTPDPSKLRSRDCGWEGERHRLVHYIPGSSGEEPSCEENEHQLCVPFIWKSLADNNCSRQDREDEEEDDEDPSSTAAKRQPSSSQLSRDYWPSDPRIGVLAACSVVFTTTVHLLCYWCSKSYRRLTDEGEEALYRRQVAPETEESDRPGRDKGDEKSDPSSHLKDE
ncbi:membrane protein UL14 [Panine betaherpesvirus 2]|uniref:Membrane protein UL14 n=1 Tax=Panine betaherpesvirus 2 TaxID=188763 RepID=Q8QS73_9BETA|nr:membrane protein UL14 [Panine betaherpesvirus 2]AAM00664.1 membrane protein UL14 [Panine betaherpesvirus 2]QXV67766.1 membrane protein UL14 [Panine betaherpesvirus 2]